MLPFGEGIVSTLFQCRRISGSLRNCLANQRSNTASPAAFPAVAPPITCTLARTMAVTPMIARTTSATWPAPFATLSTTITLPAPVAGSSAYCSSRFVILRVAIAANTIYTGDWWTLPPLFSSSAFTSQACG